MENMKGFIWNIQRYNIHDGAGIRTIVFFKGCPLSCKWCANPEGISRLVELKLNKTLCISCGACVKVCHKKAITLFDSAVDVDRTKCSACGKCAQVCSAKALELLGREVSVNEILEECEKDMIFFRRSGGGLTLSGGEALLQAEFASALLRAAKEVGMNTAIETSGAVQWSRLEKVLPYADTFLFDLKHMDSKKHKEYTGVPNELVLENARKLAMHDANLVFRMPVIPGINDTEENIKQTAEFAKWCNADYLELLPYHKLGINKYEMLGKRYQLPEIVCPSRQDMATYKMWAMKYFERVIVES